MNPGIILASSSKHRLNLIKSIGITPNATLAPDIDESPTTQEKPTHYCMRIALKKLDAALKILIDQKSFPSQKVIIITADTTAACGTRLLHKSYEKEEIKQNLTIISGRRHKVLTAVACGLIENNELKKIKKKLVVTKLRFKQFQPNELQSLLESGECEGNAGGYTLNGLASRHLAFLQGSYSNVIGLPLYETSQMLSSLGYNI